MGRHLLQSSHDEVRQTMSLLQGAATSATALATALNQPWPSVTLPDFRTKATEILAATETATATTTSTPLYNSSSTTVVGLAPIVTKTAGNREAGASAELAWGDYASQHQEWLEEYRLAQGDEAVQVQRPIAPSIIKGSAGTLPAADAPFWIPVWQTYGVTSSTWQMVNVDMITHTTNHVGNTLVQDVVGQKRAALTSVLTPNNTTDVVLFGSSEEALVACPRCSLLVAPVLVVEPDGGPSAEVGAILWATLSWQGLFAGKLPNDTRPMLVEVQNQCGGMELSFLVEGDQSTFWGVGSWHASELEEHAVSMDSFGIVTTTPQNDNNNSTTTPCPFTVTVYPTQGFKNVYLTDAAWVYSASVIFVFFVAASVFAFYDQALHQRQEKVLASARKTSAIVAELFPKNVQKRIIEEREQKINQQLHASRASLAPKSELKHLIGGRDGENQNGGGNMENYKGKPIADLFPECTIMFADVSMQSSARICSQVHFLILVYSPVESSLSSFSFCRLWDSRLGRRHVNHRKYSPCWKLFMLPLIG